MCGVSGVRESKKAANRHNAEDGMLCRKDYSSIGMLGRNIF
jgi:hypothetical protein